MTGRAGIRLLVGSCHPLPSVAVTGFATAVGLAAGLGVRSLLLAAAILCGQVSIGWANDWVDAPIDRQAGREDKPLAAVADPAGSDRWVRVAFTLALLADVPLSLVLGWRAGAAHLVAVGSAWLYDTGLKRTIASALPYLVSFGLLPVVIAGTLPGGPLPSPWLVAAAAVTGGVAHLANTVGDETEDAATGVRGMPQRLGPRHSLLLAGALLPIGAVLVVIGTRAAVPALLALAVDVACAVALPLTLRASTSRRAAFRLVLVAVAVLVVGFVVSGGHRLVSGP